MSCYRKGGCEPYEMYSCSECPASKPEYGEKYISFSIPSVSPSLLSSLPPPPTPPLEKEQKIQNQVQYHYDSLIKK